MRVLGIGVCGEGPRVRRVVRDRLGLEGLDVLIGVPINVLTHILQFRPLSAITDTSLVRCACAVYRFDVRPEFIIIENTQMDFRRH